MSSKEGYIKFKCILTRGEPPPFQKINKLNQLRTGLFLSGLVGMYPDGIGFGNVSKRDVDNSFIISCSQTGSIETLQPENYVLVTEFNIGKNIVQCLGQANASSESMTHAAVYRSLPEINVVLHIHSPSIWAKYLDKFPTTEKSAEYGTVEMAMEISNICSDGKVVENGIIIMGGHPDGILILGRNEEEAENRVNQLKR